MTPATNEEIAADRQAVMDAAMATDKADLARIVAVACDVLRQGNTRGVHSSGMVSAISPDVRVSKRVVRQLLREVRAAGVFRSGAGE